MRREAKAAPCRPPGDSAALAPAAMRGPIWAMSDNKDVTENEHKSGFEGRGKTVRARMFLITMLLLFAATVGLLVYAYFRLGPPGS